MRTTITLDDRLEQQIKELAAREKTSFKAVTNELLRTGLEVRESRPLFTFSVEAEDCGLREGIDEEKLNQLYDDMEADS
jgi:plasmid stability protein